METSYSPENAYKEEKLHVRNLYITKGIFIVYNLSYMSKYMNLCIMFSISLLAICCNGKVPIS